MKRVLHLPFLVASLMAATSCSGGAGPGGGSYGGGDPSLAATNPAGSTVSPFLADGEAVLRALDAVEAKSGSPLRVTSMDSDRA
ncbi:MAG: hypothetical protein JO199_01205, partial [Candidatus Eremiobacteraeota bacterium]|nr:hypothetical protein [Candidatus Eremiobacteraeota bacterium]